MSLVCNIFGAHFVCTTGAAAPAPYKRNQVLKRKFFELANTNQLPKHVKEWFDNASVGQHKQTEIINNGFERVGKNWVANFDKPIFKEAKERCVWLGCLKCLSVCMCL